MRPENIPKLTDVIRAYIPAKEVEQLCEIFNVELPYDYGGNIDNERLARELVIKLEHNNNRRLLLTLLETASRRSAEGVAHTSWEKQEYHRRLERDIAELEDEIKDLGIPTELDVEENKPFTAKSEIRELLSQAESEVTVVDNYVSSTTLDCLREVSTRIRLLTGTGAKNVSGNFARALEDFRDEGIEIEVRQHAKLHDRYILFNGRCWLVGSSLKDAGKKRLNVIECVDSRPSIEGDVEHKWSKAQVYT